MKSLVFGFVCFLSVCALRPSLPVAAQELGQVPQSQMQIQLSFAPLVKEAAPAVVNIYAKVIRAAQRSPFRGDPFFERFFRDLGPSRPRVQNSLGSGVILSGDGIVVSNHHVVGNATDIRVVLADRREFDARVLLADAESDLAILQLAGASGLPRLALRDSASVDVGELVLAIGNPFGVGQTVSSGIVSALARSGAVTGNARGYFIQTDAPINPGNSGGALIDMQGRLIGINTSILTRSGGSNGIGFAIPADLVAAFKTQAQKGRDSFLRPWAGMNGQPVDADMAEAFGLPSPGGIVVSVLHKQSPFAAAGLRVGDVILTVDKQRVNTVSEMIYRMSVAGFGTSVSISYLRGGADFDMQVELADAPNVPSPDETVLSRREVLEGLRVARLNPALLAELNLPLEAAGVVVLVPERLGRRVGLQRGDVIERVNDTPVAHPDDVRDVFSSSASGYRMMVLRGNRRLVLQFRV
ncbi:MAG: trypsin-like peptidase domain-containing protein [Pseudomonadota bacterium]